MDYTKMLVKKTEAEKKIYKILDSFSTETGWIVQGVSFKGEVNSSGFPDVEIETLNPK